MNTDIERARAVIDGIWHVSCWDEGCFSPEYHSKLVEAIAFALSAVRDEALASISGLTLGENLAGKISEGQAIALVNQVLSIKKQIASGTATIGFEEGAAQIDVREFVAATRSQKDPCGECHLQAGEVCDICGAKREHNQMPEKANG